MLQMLLDEHLSPVLASGLIERHPEIKVHAVVVWKFGRYRSVPDHILLEVANDENLTLVTYDENTIGPLLKNWGEQEKQHSGVIFINDRTIHSHDLGGIIRALSTLWEEERHLDWNNRIYHLRRSPDS